MRNIERLPDRIKLVACIVHSLLMFLLLAAGGCSRTEHRMKADQAAYDTIAERNQDPRWQADSYSIEMDPRSRYFEPYDQDRPPMPQDDPTSHQYMRMVAGKKGWKHWDDNGERETLENPLWREELPAYVDVNDTGFVKLNIDSALQLAYVHSPSHQSQLETLYLSALDVSTERFRMETQFLGRYGVRYDHSGALSSDHVTFGADPILQAQKRFASAGELLVGFANSFVVDFSGNGTTFGSSLANFSFIQPLLRGAGRDIALEQLTQVERTLLANVRAYHQYRQGFYTQVVIGELGVSGPRPGGAGTFIAGFGGQGGVSGFAGLLQQLQRIRNTEDSLSLQLRTLAQLEAHLEGGVIDLVQVDQFRQSIENERANLLQDRNSFELALDQYKTSILGLPPDLPLELDDSLIHQFQLVERKATSVQDDIAVLQDRLGVLANTAAVEPIHQILAEGLRLMDRIRIQLEDVQTDLALMEESVPAREQAMTEEERGDFQVDRKLLHAGWTELNRQFQQARAEVETLRDGLSAKTREITVDKTVVWLGGLFRLVQGSILVQARARLEAVTVQPIDLKSTNALQIALAQRMDFMNGRAALVDSWRSIQISADALQSSLNVTADGSIGTVGNNAADFRGSTGNLRLGLEFDTPFSRLLERNNYRRTLIEYQQERRNFIRSHDSVHLGIRGLLRQIKRLRRDLDIQRRAVAIAIRRVDLTRAALYAPVRPPQPGQRPAQFGPTAATNLLTALSALRNTQNNFLSVWLNHHAARMRLARELGVMRLDHEGRWMDRPLREESLEEAPDREPPRMAAMPPEVPADWLVLADLPARKPAAQRRAAVHTVDAPVPPRSVGFAARHEARTKEAGHVD